MNILAIIVFDRLDNIVRWIELWKQCEQKDFKMVVIHNDNGQSQQFKKVCDDNNIQYVQRENIGFDIGAFQDVCLQRLNGFDNNWENLLWCTDDVLPMSKNFIQIFLSKLTSQTFPCMEISRQVTPHIRTTGFLITKELSRRLKYPAKTITTKDECYHFEHRGGRETLYHQVMKFGRIPTMISANVVHSPLWDVGNKRHLKLNRWNEHAREFPKQEEKIMDYKRIEKICIATTFDRNYLQAGKTLFNSIRRHTDCRGIDFKVITADVEVLNELGKENCYFITDEIKSRYADVKYSPELPVEKYASSWYRYEIFNMTEYDRVICIDSDCICVRGISYLFSEELNQYDLISVEDHIVSKCFSKLVPALERQGLRLANLSRRQKEGKIDIQPALLVANKTIVNETWYKKLIHYANTAPFSYSVDEGVLNDFIYMENLKIKLLPLEWDFQDIYEIVCPTLPVPPNPIIIHCQESKPFKKLKTNLDKKMHKWHDMWWEESKDIQPKTIIAIIVWSRFENLKLWINCWNACNKMDAEMVVVHNLETDNDKYLKLCADNGIKYVPRENKGFDIGAFQDICKERLKGFPNAWDNLIWITDDCIPMSKDFVNEYLSRLSDNQIPCYEISNEVKKHIRTTGFLVTKDISKKLTFPKDPIEDREDCYHFEHKSKTSLYEQIVSMGKKPVMVNTDLKLSPLWDAGVRGHLNLMPKHESIFPQIKSDTPCVVVNSILDDMAITHKSDKSSRFHNYAVKYDKILAPFREAFTSILEIGVAQGQSLRMWTDYFSKATIHGADISKASQSCEAYSDRIKFHLLDQSNEAQLKNLEQFSPFDLIIDDGNHFWFEQILTFKTIFPYMKSGGIYICEDLTTSYWEEYNNNKISAVEYFKGLVDEVNLKGARGSVPVNPPQEFGDWNRGWHRREDCFTSLPLFDSITFFNGFIVITRR